MTKPIPIKAVRDETGRLVPYHGGAVIDAVQYRGTIYETQEALDKELRREAVDDEIKQLLMVIADAFYFDREEFNKLPQEQEQGYVLLEVVDAIMAGLDDRSSESRARFETLADAMRERLTLD